MHLVKIATCLLAILWLPTALSPAPPAAPVAARNVLVQSTDLTTAAELVRGVGGEVTHELGIIGAVAARLTDAQRRALAGAAGLRRIWDDGRVEISGNGNGNGNGNGRNPYTDYPRLVAADRLHDEGITGYGVTLAVIDSGRYLHRGLNRDTGNRTRLLAQYDAILDVEPEDANDDDNGHGAHVASIAVNSDRGGGNYNGIAPDAGLVSVKAFDAAGRGTYADVIRGLDWVVAHHAAYGIRVLNLSFHAELRSLYWEDPLNQAVMAAWRAGIVVVTSSGNGGPEPMTIGVPGNVPYVVTVGAMSDNYTPGDGSDDVLASFSAAGPTFESFVKPELVAPGGHMVALMDDSASIGLAHPESRARGSYFTMSGTSQAAAVVSGIVALMLDADPSLTPDEIKCRLMTTARPAVDDADPSLLAYSVFQQGAGLVDAYGAVYSTALGCANDGLDVDKDLAGVEHYQGLARQAADGSYTLAGLDGYIWQTGSILQDGYIWQTGYIWQDGYIWQTGYIWQDAVWQDGYIWQTGYIWQDGYIWQTALGETAEIGIWVDQE